MINDPFRASYDSLEEIADVVSEALQCPITIEDANHRLLAYSTHDERTDFARVSTIISRRVPEKVINSLWKEGIIPALLSSREPIRVKTMDDIGLGDRVAVSIWKNNEVLGFIWALEIDKFLEEKDLQVLKRATEITKNKLLQLQTRKHSKEQRFQEFFWKLLMNHFHSRDEIIEQFHSLRIVPPTIFAVVVFQFPHEITREEEKQIAYSLQTFQQPKVLLHSIDHCQLISLISLNQIDKPLQRLNKFCELFGEKMKDRFGVKSIIQGIGAVHHDYRKIGKSYREALTVLSIKAKFPDDAKAIHSYQSLGIYQYIDVILDKKVKEEYENYSLRKLYEYDQKYHCNLAETLEVYLDKDSNVNDAAKALSVHNNTMNYRLKRIAEIGEINFKDVNEKITLFLDLKLEKFSVN